MSEPLFRRERYLKKIRPYCDADDIIKAVTGVRHLNLMEFLKEDGDLF